MGKRGSVYDILNSPSKTLLEDLRNSFPDVKITPFGKAGPVRFEIEMDDIFKRSYIKFLGKQRMGPHSDMIEGMMQDTRGRNELLAIAKEVSREES